MQGRSCFAEEKTASTLNDLNNYSNRKHARLRGQGHPGKCQNPFFGESNHNVIVFKVKYVLNLMHFEFLKSMK